MRATKELNLEDFKPYFYWDESSPSGLRWKVSRRGSKRVKPGDVAGCIHYCQQRKTVCWRIKLKSKSYLAHRLVYLFNKGVICASKVIDHKDGNPLNNKVENLRLVSISENNKNRATAAQHILHKKNINLCPSLQEYYVVRWTDENNKRHSKTIRVTRTRNTKQALELATAFRDKLITQGLIQTRKKNNNKGGTHVK